MSLYQWFVDLPTESIPMLNDLVRMGIIQLVVQFLFFVVNPAENPFFSTIFLQTIGFVLIGVLVYWLIVRNIFEFRSEGGVVEGFYSSTPTPSPSLPPSSHSSSYATTTPTPVPEAEDDDDEGVGEEGE